MKVILISGNTGFIGQSILKSNIFKNQKLIFINRKKTHYKKNYLNYNFKDFKKIKNYYIELFVHLAAADPENSNKKNIIEINKKIDNILIYLQKKNKIKKIFFTSSNSIFKNNVSEIIRQNTIPKPKEVYGISKLKTEKLIKKNFKSYLILRLPSVIGVGLKKGLIYKLSKQIKKGKTIKVYNIKKKFNNILDVKDLIKIIQFYFKESIKIKKIYNVCSNDSILILNLLKFLHKIFKKKLKIIDCGISENYKYYFLSKSNFFKNFKFLKIKKTLINNVI
jgi:nucleoside-diphosphate-sugar epimerase